MKVIKKIGLWVFNTMQKGAAVKDYQVNIDQAERGSTRAIIALGACGASQWAMHLQP